MNNRDRILKYLSDTMSTGEKEHFDEELKSSEMLRKELGQIKKDLKNVSYSSDTEVNEDYFLNLVPRMRGQLSKKAYSVLGITPKNGMAFLFTIIVISFFIFKSGNFDNLYNLPSSNQLAFADDSVLSNYLDFSYYSNQMNSDNTGDLEEIDESGLGFNELEGYLLDNSADLSTSINELVDEEELLSVIDELSQKKIL